MKRYCGSGGGGAFLMVARTTCRQAEMRVPRVAHRTFLPLLQGQHNLVIPHLSIASVVASSSYELLSLSSPRPKWAAPPGTTHTLARGYGSRCNPWQNVQLQCSSQPVYPCFDILGSRPAFQPARVEPVHTPQIPPAATWGFGCSHTISHTEQPCAQRA